MLEVAIMIPMTDKAARNAWLYPKDWPAPPPAVRWPENGKSGRPRFPGEAAAEVQAEVEEAMPKWERLAIITRSEIVALRLRRMVAEGASIAVTVHFPGSDHLPAVVKPNGEVDSWPEGLSLESFEEVKAIRRAQRVKGE